MLFNSYEFLFLFLPACVLAYYALGLAARRAAAPFLCIASLVFYGAWNPAYVPLLVASIAWNFMIGLRLIRPGLGDGQRHGTLLLGIGMNLVLLSYYKYLGFLARSFLEPLGIPLPEAAVPGELPLGISFYTFTQIAFLVDCYRREATEPRPFHYGLFVTFFPHLIAGPILHHKEMMPQFERPETYRFDARLFSRGLWFFSIGLAKKVLVADGIARFVGPVFNDPGYAPTLVEAWAAALAYTFQLYFDFSGYSDMAVGLALLFGISLPLNFDSPYKAASIIEFWKRWHMTLSRFLRDYLYFPLGGNRKGASRRYVNLMIVMLLGGLWHGAGWTFVLWGGMHGVFLVVNHAFRHAAGGRRPGVAARGAFVLLTFVCVVFAWVMFRAQAVDHALGIMAGMVGANGLVLLPNHLARLGVIGDWLIAAGVQAGDISRISSLRELVAWLALCFGLAWLLPNTQDWARLLFDSRRPARLERLAAGALGLAAGIAFAVTVYYISKGSEFLYFQF